VKRTIDRDDAEENARLLTNTGLCFAYFDAVHTARIWDKDPDEDADGNGPYYHDLAIVYRSEAVRRGLAWMVIE